MPTSLTYPGVYIEEIPSGVHTIIGVSTSTTAFIGRALQGPTDVEGPVAIYSFGDYDRIFGGLWTQSTMSYAVQQFFQNGGTQAVIVRLVKNGKKAQFDVGLKLEAQNEGTWGNNIQISIDHKIRDLNEEEEKKGLGNKLFNITIEVTEPGVFTDAAKTKKKVITSETFRNVSVDKDDPRFVGKILAHESTLVQLQEGEDLPEARPDETPNPKVPDTNGDDGDPLTDADYVGEGKEGNKIGIYALEKADIFNLLCIPPITPDLDVAKDTWSKAQEYCKNKRAFLLIDSPSGWAQPASPVIEIDGYRGGFPDYSAIYFPRVMIADPLKENRLGEFVPCGVVAGIYARTDAQRGVWKAPAGTETMMSGVQDLTIKLTDGENGALNPLGVNCLRNFPAVNNVVWGARTLAGADRMASEWKYIPIRRLALYIEESLFRGTQWVVFEPNDEPLWAQVRLNVGAFMHNLFRQGAFQGRSPREAYFVKCDGDTTTQNDRDSGIVNILVGFAPLKPAEFVIIKIQQMAGNIET